MNGRREAAVRQLQAILDEYAEAQRLESRLGNSDRSIMSEARTIARSRAAIDRIAGRHSPYMRQCDVITGTASSDGYQALQIAGGIEALKADVENGYIDSLVELAHADVFSDYLDMADHLLDNGYKDAAAVIVGSTLESHLRQMYAKAGVPLDEMTHSGNLRQRTGSRLNDELAKAQVYNSVDKKQVDAWLDLRNKAAHGKYGEYEAGQIKMMSAGVRDFIRRFAA